MPIDPDRLQDHAPFLRNLARALVRNEHDAEDLVQDTLSAALEPRAAPRGDLRGWLVGVARNLARNRVRGERRRRRREHAAARGEAVTTDAPRGEIRRILARAVAALPEPERSIVLLRYFEEQRAAEIARRFGVTPKTIRQRLRRAHARLRGELDRRYGKTKWIASLLAIAGLPRRVAATAALAAAALVLATGAVVVSLIAASKDDEPRREKTVAEIPLRRSDPPLSAPQPEPAPEPAPVHVPVPVPVPEKAAPAPKPAPAKKQAKPTEPKRPAAVAGIHNAPQKPLPKQGCGVAWGREQTWRSPTGRHVVIATRRGQHFDDLAFDYEFMVGSRLLNKGTIHQLPEHVTMLESEPGAVLFERYSHHGYGNTLSYIDWTGKLRWTLRLEDLFTAAERARFEEFDKSIMWSWKWTGFWVLESRRTALLLSVHHTLVEVALDTGVPKRTDASALRAATREGPTEARARALEALVALRPKDLDTLLKELAQDGPLAERARELLSREKVAALIARLAGPVDTMPQVRAELAKWGQAALAPLRAFANDKRPPALARLRALHALDETAPTDLLALGVLQIDDAPLARWSEKRLVDRGGDAAATALLEHIRDEALALQPRREATRVLARVRSDAAFDALVQLAGHPDNIVVWHCKAGLHSFPAKDLDQRFEALLLKGSPADAAIAEYFQLHPRKRVVEALLRAMERNKDAQVRRLLGYAVQRCSGRWVREREDPAAWRRELNK